MEKRVSSILPRNISKLPKNIIKVKLKHAENDVLFANLISPC